MQQKEIIPAVVCIGFFCHDIHADGYILGGTASYSSLMLQKLGKQTSVLTSVGEDFLFFDKFKKAGIQVHNKLAPQTTIFENVYNAQNERTQYISSRALTLSEEDLPTLWKQTPLVKLCLIADEAAPSLLKAFPNAMIAATIQGWLRQWDAKGKVSAKAMDWELLRMIDIVLFSEDDLIGFEDKLPLIREYVKIAVMTNGKKGATVFYQGETYHFPALPTNEIDPTGAGDIFAGAFLYHFSEHQDIVLATAYAHAAASFVVEGLGIQLPTKTEVAHRFKAYLDCFPMTSLSAMK